MARKSQGGILQRGGVEVAEITGLDGPDGEANEIDVTHLRSIQKEYLIGLSDPGNMNFTGWWNPSDPAQTAMRADSLNQTPAVYTVTLTDTPPSVLTFTAYVKAMKPAIAPDGAIGLTGARRITGNAVWS